MDIDIKSILNAKVSKFIADHQLMSKEDRLLLGLSGGADSVCLLLLLLDLGYNVSCVHCNFHLRGDESNRDEEFCRALCNRLSVDLDVVDFDTIQYATSKGLSIEMAARELRYDYFVKKMREFGYSKVCIAHHQDDQVETFFINLLRGSGMQGLCGIPVNNGFVVRPLLCCSRTDILSYVEKCGESYITDSSNLSTDYVRNQIRLELLPVLEKINSSSRMQILTTMENLREEQKIYKWSVCRMEEECSYVKDGMLYISKEGLQRSPSPLSLLHEILRDCGFNRSQMLQIISSLDRVGNMFYSNQFLLTVDREYLVVSGIDDVRRERLNYKLEGDAGRITFPSGDAIDYKILSAKELEINKDTRHAYFDYDKLGRDVVFRGVIDGDCFIPFGMKGKKLVNDLLGEKKMNRIEKARQLVMESKGKISWVIGVRSSEEFRVDERSETVVVMVLV